ncbi:Stp1/IreP family PP2C-type Ser/Thr phosphatase [Acidiferrimicrobium sp. IK]|uniref:Stp1/IreP family PP2C-type Ser/Thr phosphatase n=1 Tax=Acidiferrimicrobium sp. IK TaxID=2871700 RepID=UPI0021CB815B|nr:Stp1/IreP family PP2C-type Ser/Thr phosphatase [Acidiferrimicrobium sp. IK]MCU4186117.1 Stp1/IreP family PP2C-type Ser/Thr phosphatase [Acidiferrimicrobium sp. IK]
MTVLRAGAATDTGLVRANNQDQLLLADSLYAVADGMGGHAAGEVASDTAVKALEAAWSAGAAHDPGALAAAAKEANRKVWQTAQSDPELRGMGTTLVAVALTGSGDNQELAVVNVGDSRVYLLRDGELEQLTVDHSLVAELVAEGQLRAEEAEFHPQRHVLTRALGVDSDVPVDLLTVAPFKGDRLLLCSDGLIREVKDNQVASVLRRLSDPTEAAKELVAEAKLRGGSDNITVVVVDVLDDGDRAAQASAALTPERDATATLLPASEVGKEDVRDPTTAVPVVPPVAAPAPAVSRRQRRRAERAAAPARPRARLVTVRVVLFFLLLLAVLGAAAGALAWYGRGSYYVGLSGQQITIYKGRPGGVLWIKPTVAQRTAVTTAQVESRHIPDLQSGVTESSMSAAQAYVANLTREFQQAQAQG